MKSLKLMAAVGGYIGALLWAYAAVVSPAFSNAGFSLIWPNPASMVWLVVLALLPAMLLPYSIKMPSALVLWWLYLSTYVPSILIPALSLDMPIERLFPLQVSLLLSMGLLCLVPWWTSLSIGRLSLSTSLFWTLFLPSWLACVAVVIVTGHPQNLVANITGLLSGYSEYDIRRAYMAESSHGVAYLVGQLGQALDPFLIAYGMVYDRKALIFAGILGQVVIFSFTGFKTVLFSTFLLPLVFLFMRRGLRSFGIRFTAGLMAIIVTCGVVDLLLHSSMLSGMITRRTLAAPGLLTGFYFEHYSQIAHTGIGYRLGSGTLYGPSNEIGHVYFGGDNVDANANMWAEGFADFGIPGIFGFTVLVAFLIWMYDSISHRHKLDLAVLLAVMPAISLGNTSPTTVLLTHGALAIATLLYLSPIEELAEAPVEEDIESVEDEEEAQPKPIKAAEEEPELESVGAD